MLSEDWRDPDFSLPTDIQNEGIPMILGGGDVLMVCLSSNLVHVVYLIIVMTIILLIIGMLQQSISVMC